MDPNIDYVKKVIKRIEPLRTISKESLYSLAYKMEKENYEKGQYITKSYDFADCLIIVLSGVCKVKTECEGNEFILDYLYRGSIVNHRAFLVDDLIYVDIICETHVQILKLTRKAYEQI